MIKQRLMSGRVILTNGATVQARRVPGGFVAEVVLADGTTFRTEKPVGLKEEAIQAGVILGASRS